MKQTMDHSPAYPICKMQIINIADTVLGPWQYCRNMTVLSHFYKLCLCSMSHKSWSSCGRFYSYPPGLWTNVLISLRVISLALWQSFDYPGACVVFLVYMEIIGWLYLSMGSTRTWLKQIWKWVIGSRRKTQLAKMLVNKALEHITWQLEQLK